MPFKLLNKVTGASCSAAIKLARGTMDHTVEVNFDSRAATAISACVVKLQGSIDGKDKDTGVVCTPGLAIDGTAEKFGNAAFVYRLNGVSYTKAADTAGNAFTTAHVVGNGSDDLWGVIGIYINSAGTFVSRVPASPQVYTTAEAAQDALEAMVVPESLCYVGKILLNADAKTWTANTSDMTDGSDITTADFYSAISGFYDLQTYTLSAGEITAKQAMFHVVNKPVNFVRAYLSTLTGTGEVTVRYSMKGR